MAKIMLITLEYQPYHGGIARYLGGLMHQLREEKHEVLVIGADSACDVQMKMLSSHVWPRWILPLLTWARHVKKFRPDYIVTSHLIPIGYACLIFKIFFKIPYIVFVHGLDVGSLKGRKKIFGSYVLKNAEKVFANSIHTQKIVSQLVNENDRVEIVYPGVQWAESATNQRHARAIISIGRLVERKGFDVLIRAMSIVRTRIPDVVLHIIGEGPQEQALKKMAVDLGDIVQFHGSLNDKELEDVYKKVDVFCLIPRIIKGDSEGFGMVYIEAAMRGIPAVAGNSGGVGEAVVNNETGILVNPQSVSAVADALIRLLIDDDFRKKLGASARNRAIQSFMWKTTSAPMVEFLKTRCLLISIIIPVYNHEKELRACLASLYAQTYSNIEIIIVDDGSDEPVSCADHRVRVIRKKNGGAPSARNTGRAHASGEYVLFCDADIVWKKNALRLMVDALIENQTASYAYSHFYFGWKHFNVPSFSSEELKKNNFIHTSSLIRKKDVVLFDESLKKFQDWDIWLTLLKQGKSGVRVDKTLFKIKPRGSGMSHWLPSFMYRYNRLKKVRDYHRAAEIVRKKHGI